jgi:hypothetical protein
MSNSHAGDAPGQNKDVPIYVNGTPFPWTEKKITYEQVVKLVFPNSGDLTKTAYTVEYKKGEDKKPHGSMVYNDTVPVKDGMRFDVTPTDQS